MIRLAEHPFAVDARFRRSLVLSFSAPVASLRPLLPPQFTVDSFDSEHGFLAVAVVDTAALRPACFPAFLSTANILVGYRIFVRFKTHAGRRLRGLYILRSETNSRSMAFLGNIFTRYKYQRTGIHMSSEGGRLRVTEPQRGLDIVADTDSDAILPSGSVFRTWQEARRFAGPLPFTFSLARGSSDIVVVEGAREHWTPRPVAVLKAEVPFLENLVPDLRLANAFIVEDIAYHWKKGRRELWRPDAADLEE